MLWVMLKRELGAAWNRNRWIYGPTVLAGAVLIGIMIGVLIMSGAETVQCT